MATYPKKMMRTAYGEALVKLGKKNPDVVVLDADLAHATFTGIFQQIQVMSDKATPPTFYTELEA